MKTNRRRFLARVSAVGAAAAVGPVLEASLGHAGRPAAPQAVPRDRPGGTHSIVSRELPQIFIDPCMQIWPDADLATAHRHGVTAYGVTAWDPNVTVDVALKNVREAIALYLETSPKPKQISSRPALVTTVEV